MMTVGIRELKQQTSKILRCVRDGGETIEITYHGEPIARLAPISPQRSSSEEIAAVLADLDELSAEISALWPEDSLSQRCTARRATGVVMLSLD